MAAAQSAPQHSSTERSCDRLSATATARGVHTDRWLDVCEKGSFSRVLWRAAELSYEAAIAAIPTRVATIANGAVIFIILP
jgi:hypothetical protein